MANPSKFLDCLATNFRVLLPWPLSRNGIRIQIQEWLILISVFFSGHLALSRKLLFLLFLAAGKTKTTECKSNYIPLFLWFSFFPLSLIYSVLSISTVQQSDPYYIKYIWKRIYIYIYIFFSHIILHHVPSQVTTSLFLARVHCNFSCHNVCSCCHLLAASNILLFLCKLLICVKEKLLALVKKNKKNKKKQEAHCRQTTGKPSPKLVKV